MTMKNWTLGAAGAALVTAAAVAFAVPGAAHPHPDSEGKGEKIERVIILSDVDGKAGPHKRIRTFHIDRDGLDCDGDKTEVDEGSDGDKDRTRVIICGKGGDPAAHAERLEKALSRIQSNEHLSGEHRERVVARLRETIERLRSRNP